MGMGELCGCNDDEKKPRLGPLLLSLSLKAQNGELLFFKSGRLLATVQTIF